MNAKQPIAYRSTGELSGLLAASIRPPKKVSLLETVQNNRRFKVLNGLASMTKPMRMDKTPFLIPVLEWLESREVTEVYIAGPSQFGKSELFLTVSAHAILYKPQDILIVQPTKDTARDFITRRLDRMLDASVDNAGRPLRTYLAPGRSADKAMGKLFKSGMQIDCVYPTVEHLSSKPVPIVLMDERDRMTDDVGGSKAEQGEGDPVRLGKARLKTHPKEGKILVACSPSRPNGTGITALVKSGPQYFVAVKCLHCGEYWTPGFDAEGRGHHRDLHIAAPDDPEYSREKVSVHCQECSAGHFPADQAALLKASVLVLKGMKVPRDWDVDRDGRVYGPKPTGRRRTLWVHGLVNGFQEWGDLAADLVSAEIEYRETGNERPLRTVYNTGFGINYVSKADGLPPLETDDLKARRLTGWNMGTVPVGARYLTASVDIQGNRFAVCVFAHGDRRQMWVVDRFDILTLADAKTEIRPATQEEHWWELFPRVLDLRYPLVSDPSRSLGIVTTAIDTGGEAGVADKARAFWHEARRRGYPELGLMMVKGATRPEAPVLARPSYDRDIGGKPMVGGYRWYMVGSHALKGIVAARLRRDQPGPGYIGIPGNMAENHIAEWTAEVLVDGVWTKIRRANETLDLTCYAIAAVARLRPGRINWADRRAWPPWAVPRAAEGVAMVPAAPAPVQAAVDPVAAPVAPPVISAPAPVPRRPGVPTKPRPVARRPGRGGGGGFVKGCL